ncbi:MAG: energy transducer TonB [Pyrinomonadaceae bacterium]
MKVLLTALGLFSVFATSVEAQRNPSALNAKRGRIAASVISTHTLSSPGDHLGDSAKNDDLLVYRGPDAPPRILSRPRAKYPKAGVICAQGSVLLKVHLLADRTIGPIQIVRGMPLGLNERAIEAAKRITFVPKIAKGVYVQSVMTIEYPFTRY